MNTNKRLFDYAVERIKGIDKWMVEIPRRRSKADRKREPRFPRRF